MERLGSGTGVRVYRGGMTTLRAGQVAEAAGVNRQTLRYYERCGLLPVPPRTPGGHRLYPVDAVTVVRTIKAAQRLGFRLDEVRDLVAARPGRRRSLRGPAAAKLAEVDARIQELHLVRETLAAALDAGCDDLAACATSPACPVPFDSGTPAGRQDRPTT